MVDKILDNWKKAQESGAWLPCPRCGLMRMDEKLQNNALSRKCSLYICDTCGIEEALEDSPFCPQHKPLPVEEWFVPKNVYRRPGIVKKGKGFEVDVFQTIFLTVQDIDDIMVGALEGGITYWADAADVIESERVSDWGHEQIARGGVLMIHDAEEDKTYDLTLEKFLTGFKLWVEQGLDHYNAVVDGRVDCCEIDASCADNIVQLALFGEVVYG